MASKEEVIQIYSLTREMCAGDTEFLIEFVKHLNEVGEAKYLLDSPLSPFEKKMIEDIVDGKLGGM